MPAFPERLCPRGADELIVAVAVEVDDQRVVACLGGPVIACEIQPVGRARVHVLRCLARELHWRLGKSGGLIDAVADRPRASGQCERGTR
jgi:hypothetical protein